MNAGLPAKTNKRMKNITKLLVAASAAMAFSSQAGAGEALLSPRAKANQITVVTAIGSDPDRSAARPRSGVAALTKVSGSRPIISGTYANDPALLRGQWAGRISERIEQLRESGREFMVAPLK
jgi:hypothetical protein